MAAPAADRRADEGDILVQADGDDDWGALDGEVDISGLEMWERQDYNVRAFKSSNRDGPNWKLAKARETHCMDTGDIVEELRRIDGVPSKVVFEPLDPPRNRITRLYGEPAPERPRPSSSDGRPLLCDRDQLPRGAQDL
eukprot:6209525-Pyramimonas_sp.AAC.1